MLMWLEVFLLWRYAGSDKVRHVSEARGSSDGTVSTTFDIGLEYLDLDSNTVSPRVSASHR